ncbi:MAG: tRNA pseudouridine(55) synthase TruB [Legionellales bacterium]|nr:tRNA pseudouridine(55) synthase TruB [Legionellales bacterium]|tara:strand:+ start:2026 stop:2913 length:888 start_codon:yes stop_codon:yes gene_type:complete
MDGLLILDKPSGVTSFDMVRQSKRWFNQRKVGHAGTLDPLASGLLVICLGQATRYAQYFLEADKQYQVTLKLGETTDTLDSEGTVLTTSPVPSFTKEDVVKWCSRFRGMIQQVPPMYSALKKEGVPLYKLAREGKTVERSARKVCIHQLDVLSVDSQFITLNVHCSKGTYIRTLVDDLGQVIGCGAHVVKLRRLASAPFSQQMMQCPEKIEALAPNERSQVLVSTEIGLRAYQRIDLSLSNWNALQRGQVCSIDGASGLKSLFYENTFVGLGEMAVPGTLKVKRLQQIPPQTRSN